MSDLSISPKQCTRCGESFPATSEFFHKKPGGKLHATCKSCSNELSAIYRASHRQQESKRVSAYFLTEKGKLSHRATEHRRRAKIVSSGGNYTVEELQDIIAAHTDSKGQLHCAFCGKVIKGDYHIDHWIPLIEGGDNNAGNLRVMHSKCNLAKHRTHPVKLGRLL